MKHLPPFSIFLFLLSFSLSFGFKVLGPKWPGGSPMVGYYLQEEGTPDALEEFEAVKQAFQTWEDVEEATIRFQYLGFLPKQGTAPDKKNVLKWEEGNAWKLGKHVIAATFYWYNGTALTDADVEFNGRDFSWSTTGETGKMDVGQVTLHEAGHFLGLDHSTARDAVMWPTAAAGDTSKRVLHQDDADGVVFLYPRTTVNNHPPVITSAPVTEAVVGVKYTYQVAANDEDGDPLRFKLLTKPLNMKIDSVTGLIWWYPKFLDLGGFPVTVEVRDSLGASARQSYTVNVGDLVVYTADTTVNTLDTFYYGVHVTPMDGYNIVAGNIEIGYNAQEVALLNLDTIGSVLKGASYAKNIAAGTARIAFAGPDPFSGGGLLFRLKMLVFDRQCGKDIELPIVKALFNDGDPRATPRNGTIFSPCPPSPDMSVDGKVLYEANRVGVSGADVRIIGFDGEELNAAVTTGDGFFYLDNLPAMLTGAYPLTAAKDSGDIRDAVSAYDASLILRHVVGLHGLKTYTRQKTAADVNGNALISAYDAAQILRFLVGYNDLTRIGRWELFPDTLYVKALTEPRHGLEFTACMVGDVSGNWNEYDKGMPKDYPGLIATLVFPDFVPGDSLREPAGVRGTFTTILSTRAAIGVFSGEMQLDFDAAHYDVAAVRPLAMLNGFTSAFNVAGNRLHLAFAGTDSLAGTGELFEITLAGKAGTTAIPTAGLGFLRFNEADPKSIGIERPKSAPAIPAPTGLAGIHPNPFNPSVEIQYSLADRGPVRLTVYDAAGRLVKRLVREKDKLPGRHRVVWNGRDGCDIPVAAGVYLLRFEGRGLSAAARLYLIR